MRIRPAKVKIKIGEPFYARDVIAASRRSDRQISAAAKAAGSATVVSSTRDTVTADNSYDIVTRHLKSTIAAMLDELRSN